MVQRVPWCRWLVLLFACVACRAEREHASAVEDSTASEPPWLVLFDGATLAGWKESGFGGGGAIRVTDGRLILEQGSPITGVTFVGAAADSQPHGDYELELTAARLAGTDFFCALTFPVGEGSLTLVLGGWGGTLCGLSCLDGRDASSNGTTCYRKFEKGRTYHVRLRVDHERVSAWLDGEPLIDVDTHGRKLSLRPEVERCAPLGIATYATTGAIGPVRWRPSGRGRRSRPRCYADVPRRTRERSFASRFSSARTRSAAAASSK